MRPSFFAVLIALLGLGSSIRGGDGSGRRSARAPERVQPNDRRAAGTVPPVVTGPLPIHVEAARRGSVSGDSASLAALDQAIEDAITNKRVASLDSILGPTFRWTHNGGPHPVESRERFLAGVGAPVRSDSALRTVSRTADSIVVEVHDDVALTTGRIHVLRTGGNVPLLRDFTLRYIRVYRRDATTGRWMLAMHRAIDLHPGPPPTVPR